MKKNGPLDKALRAVVVFLAACSVHITTVNSWNNVKPNDWWDFSPEGFRMFYEQNSTWEMVEHHWLTLIYLVLLATPVIVIVLTVRYLVTGKLRKNPPAPGCCEHCEAKAKAITADQA